MAIFLYRSCVRTKSVELYRNFSGINLRQIHTPCRSTVAKIYSNTSSAMNGSLIRHSFKCSIPWIRLISARNMHSSKPLKNSLPLETNTNVAKDVIMFKHDNARFFKILNIFALTQFLFWTYLSHFCYTQMKDAPVAKEKKEDQQWWRSINLGENKYKNTLAVFCFIIGYGILAGSWMFTLKSVRYLVLRKGGKEVTFVTYGPFGKNRMLTVGLENVSCEESRKSATTQVPIKVKGHLLYYMLDMRGEFKNGKLFDVTAGMKRVLI
ncbi:hypothetical protein J437_LFUL009575 [Ladona fulva]|uniref:Transmembrane protein 223 n=1 Tax=Ladona fulva TaxID=123851 RepID=A0A8K0K7G2_LADFU|nr:hypothetical protein J437_LFUL009575 [Ladona fulva]